MDSVLFKLILILLQKGNHLLYLVEKYQVVILVGQTGCGKTTRAWILYVENERLNESLSLLQRYLSISMKLAGVVVVTRSHAHNLAESLLLRLLLVLQQKWE